MHSLSGYGRRRKSAGGVIEDTDYGADVMLTVLTPEGETTGYLAALTELSSGSIKGEKLERVFRAYR